MPVIVSPLKPSAPMLAMAAARATSSVRPSAVSHGVKGMYTLTPRAWKRSTAFRTSSTPPGMLRSISSWLRSSTPMLGYGYQSSSASMPPKRASRSSRYLPRWEIVRKDREGEGGDSWEIIGERSVR